ncbi:hypothetical protein DICPUDRAFT_85728 [Dictyostelium purpureum]|uniref:Uncharacterized protein n=1 Tax=Dictyostelium purpureum TaxID=5786 RepID=F0Z6P1_DICPU|nr:uncharacterized protein DICPUDRAFT_85728 [Dictyostelium purpureum]EGC40344.1 hypothetical protein DICPUDRAFT_85728 [Dictyostelium purpureum]|eukprot:XP_003283095.1 hypothetical protein DICPUDRAFT_85728 [Dictyostelium purpureum]
MAQSSLKIKKAGSTNKVSKVGLNKKKKQPKSVIAQAKAKMNKKLESTITQKIETEMTSRFKKNNGKLSVLKSQEDPSKKQAAKKK